MMRERGNMAERGAWWQRPQLITVGGEERRVSWLELFYDLVFVVVVSQLSHYLVEHTTLSGALAYILLFVPVWWVWIGGTFYNARFESFDISYRLLTLLQMLPVAAMAIYVHEAAGETSQQFALSYAAARVLITFLWLRGGWHTPAFRPVSNRYAAGFIVSIILFVASVWVAPPLRFVIWGLGLLSDLLTPLATLRLQAGMPQLSNAKLPERFGLFVIIVLGEGVVSVVNGLAEGELTAGRALDGLLGMALIFGLWWIYFDFVGRRAPQPHTWSSFAWGYLHLPLVMSITAVGAGVLRVLASASPVLDPPARLLALALGLALVTLGLLELTLRRDADEPTHALLSPALKFATGLAAILIGLLAAGLSHAALALALFALELVLMAYGGYVWFHAPPATAESA
jgi:low temperature requirement protein LtrA